LDPTVTLGNIGVDENVFNEAIAPKRDFTMTLSPRTNLWMRFLGTWFTGTINEDIVWYQRYASERSGNNTYSLNWKIPVTRLTANLFTSRASTRERQGFEIDERAKRSQGSYSAALAFNVLTNTSIDFTARRDAVSYDEDVTFNGINLHDELNVVSTSLSVGVTRKLTPLTTATVSLRRKRDRFPFNPIRDADSTEAGMAVKFDAVALLKGSFSIAYSQLSPLSPDVIPGVSGLTLAANLSYTLYDATKITLRADRGWQNSYVLDTPYYIQSGFVVEVAQQVFTRLDVVGRGGLEHLNYRNRVDAFAPAEELVALGERTDRVTTYGVGLGYHLGRATRIGVNYDQTRRDSIIVSRRYDRPSVGAAVTFDF
jgi:hypothetical protein